MEAVTFSLKEAIDLLNSQTQRSDSLWMFYWIVTGAVLGFGYGKEIVRDNWKVKLGLTLGYVVFTSINIGALWVTQETLVRLADGIRNAANNAQLVDPLFAPALKFIKRASGYEMLGFHLFLDVGVVLALWLPNLISRFQSGKSISTS